jgi:Flp pilus assembly protein TadG
MNGTTAGNLRARLAVWSCARLWGDTQASQIVEFAFTIPLLVVFVVGIFDFGSAFAVKQKLANAVREGARIAASQPSSDLSNTPLAGCGAPASICAVRDAVDLYLTAGKVNDCGLSTATAPAPLGLAWTFTTTGSCAGPLTLIINRGVTYTVAMTTPYTSNLTVEASSVQMSYPYKWQFNTVITLLVPGASYAASTQLTAASVMQNLNN